MKKHNTSLTSNELLQLAFYYDMDLGKPEKAIPWYRKAAAAGESTAQAILGEMLAEGVGCKKDQKAAIDLWVSAADKGEAEAMVNLGRSFFYGEGVEQDFSQALLWYRKAARRQSKTACFNLGLIYLNGDGIRKNENLSLKYFSKALELGYKKAAKYIRRLQKTAKAKCLPSDLP